MDNVNELIIFTLSIFNYQLKTKLKNKTKQATYCILQISCLLFISFNVRANVCSAASLNQSKTCEVNSGMGEMTKPEGEMKSYFWLYNSY
jgi:hypothetical protein